MKTSQPLILTARLSDSDLQPFDLLRQAHFPPDRNFLRAHLTMFHRLPGEYRDRIVAQLYGIARTGRVVAADVTRVRHLGAGVAFAIASPELQAIHATLKSAFAAWLGPQDMQKWQPHITVQNKVSRLKADRLYHDLTETFRPFPITIVGLDLWKYLNGPWELERSVMFQAGMMGKTDKP